MGIKYKMSGQEIKTILLCFACIVFISACKNNDKKVLNDVPKAPDCNDSRVKENVLSISKEAIKTGLRQRFESQKTCNEGFEYGINNVRTTNINKDIGKFECAADLVLNHNSEESKIPITYSSELSDGGKNFYVTVFGLDSNMPGPVYGIFSSSSCD